MTDLHPTNPSYPRWSTRNKGVLHCRSSLFPTSISLTTSSKSDRHAEVEHSFCHQAFLCRSAQTVPVGQTSQSFLNGCLSWGISAIKLPYIKNCPFRLDRTRIMPLVHGLRGRPHIVRTRRPTRYSLGTFEKWRLIITLRCCSVSVQNHVAIVPHDGRSGR